MHMQRSITFFWTFLLLGLGYLARAQTPVYDIALVTADANADGEGDSLNVECELRGVVYGIDLQGAADNIQFTLIDPTGGLGVVSFGDNLGYTVQEGDSLHVTGTVSAFRGLTQLDADSIELISSGNDLVMPTVVTTLNEGTESELIRIDGVTVVDPSDWPTAGNSANVDITDGTNTFTVRIDSDTDIDGTPVPGGEFDIIGLGGQFSFNPSDLDGYQILPRSSADILATPVYPIDLVTADADGDGIGDSSGVTCELRGVVYGVDLQGSANNVQFTLIDGSGGIGVASFGDTYGYTVQEGDSVNIVGTIGAFRGLTQINPDTIILVSSGNDLVMPTVVDSLGEYTESELIRIDGVTVVDPSDWPTAGNSANVDITDGTSTFTLRIDSDTDIDGTPVPPGTFDVIGLGGQFDSNTPATGGYQILPRFPSDIIEIAAPGFSFAPTSLTVGEDAGTVTFEVSLASAVGTGSTVDVSLGAGTAMDGMDFSAWSDTTLSFAAGEVGPLSLSLVITDDADVEATETIELLLSNPTGGPILGDSVLIINIEDNDYVQYDIATVTADANGDGLPDSLGVVCELTGIVYGMNQQGSNLNFVIIDSTGGISTFSRNDFGYGPVTQGDEITIQGEITEFRGLAQIAPDTLFLVSSGNDIMAPMVVDSLGEFTESEYIRIECMTLVDTADWQGGGSFNIDITNGVDTFTMRIDADTDARMAARPESPFAVTGLGWQFSFDDPPLGGYQIIPQFMDDIELLPAPELGFRSDSITVFEADGVAEAFIDYMGNRSLTEVDIAVDTASSTATAGDDYSFTDTTLAFNACGMDSLLVSATLVDDGVNEGEELLVLVLSNATNEAVLTVDTLVIRILDGTNGLPVLPSSAVNLFPNPAQSEVTLQAGLRMESVQVYDLVGQQVMAQGPRAASTRLNLTALPSGVYTVRVMTSQGQWIGKLIRE